MAHKRKAKITQTKETDIYAEFSIDFRKGVSKIDTGIPFGPYAYAFGKAWLI